MIWWSFATCLGSKPVSGFFAPQVSHGSVSFSSRPILNCLDAGQTAGIRGKTLFVNLPGKPAAIRECDMLLMLENGARAAFGPKDDVLRNMVKNHEQIARNAGPGGVR